jgi:hypothetical protein
VAPAAHGFALVFGERWVFGRAVSSLRWNSTRSLTRYSSLQKQPRKQQRFASRIGGIVGVEILVLGSANALLA